MKKNTKDRYLVPSHVSAVPGHWDDTRGYLTILNEKSAKYVNGDGRAIFPDWIDLQKPVKIEWPTPNGLRPGITFQSPKKVKSATAKLDNGNAKADWPAAGRADFFGKFYEDDPEPILQAFKNRPSRDLAAPPPGVESVPPSSSQPDRPAAQGHRPFATHRPVLDSDSDSDVFGRGKGKGKARDDTTTSVETLAATSDVVRLVNKAQISRIRARP